MGQTHMKITQTTYNRNMWTRAQSAYAEQSERCSIEGDEEGIDMARPSEILKEPF